MRFFKKIAAVLAACALLTSCNGGSYFLPPAPPDADRNFVMTAKITAEKNEYTAALTRTAAGCWEIGFLEPYELEGLSFSYTPTEITASFGEFSVQATSEDFALSVLSDVISAYESAAADSTSATVTSTEDTLLVDYGGCRLAYPDGSEQPLQMQLSSGIIVDVLDYSLNDVQIIVE